MSNLAKLITATRGTKVAHDLEPLGAICEVSEHITSLQVYNCIEYKIGVKLGASVMVSEFDRGNLPFAVERVKRNIIESVFGEFRADFAELSLFILQRNYHAAGQKIAAIETKMFDM